MLKKFWWAGLEFFLFCGTVHSEVMRGYLHILFCIYYLYIYIFMYIIYIEKMIFRPTIIH